ncbi:hypothetical protein KBY66_14745 [Synechococcus sp. Tobar12-5m-g]|uniref:DUF6444 domain-containing protein n=1 Tax=unclassified Synechococcus TaxID=2626047 RepID=UPI0020CDE7C3|nr:MULTISPECIES: DUF6444 domain-containing protein [unclassified Synechococcus]MCP9773850.1 hypothetical protein [Synechococcus sp. Tobar12-5m-g]MCP9874981.1 hypothetical protein [Synechococcus sp. Cruz CV-v-12]
MRIHLIALATQLASLREQIVRSSRNSSKPPSSDGPGFKSLQKNQSTKQFFTSKSGFPAQKDGSAAIRSENSPISAWLACLQGIA